MVTAPEKLVIAAGTITSAIAGSVEMCIRIVAERITNKSFCGQLGTVQITARHAVAADIEITMYADGHGLQVVIENIDLRIGDRPPDINGSITGFNSVDRRPYRRLRGSIEIPNGICAIQ